MKRIAVLTAALATAASVGVPAAQATSVAYCNPGNVNGSITYTPALVVAAPLTQTVSWTLTLTMTCTGTAPSAGTYSLTIQGSGLENCQAGTGGGNVQSGGTKTGGSMNGTIVGGGWNFTRGTLHYYGYPPSGNGNITVVTREGRATTYTMHLWLDVIPSTPNPGGPGCPGFGGPIVGHATISE